MKTQKRYAMIGAAGYIAPRHMKAIKDTDNELVALLDPYDGIGIIDSYFPNALFFKEPERFDRHLYKLSRDADKKIDYVSICSPNYLHDAHIRLALRNQAHAICEKPLVLNPWNIDALAEIEEETGKSIYTILQLRLHESIIKLKNKIDSSPQDKIHDIDLTYITGRGNWYDWSWKGDASRSGGVATNIGIHFFDMLTWIFGDVKANKVHLNELHKAAGFMQLKNANIRWFLSIDVNDLPDAVKGQKRTYRSILLDGEEIEFSDGFTELHTESYKNILSGKGFGLKEAKSSIQIVYDIRNGEISKTNEDYHPFIKNFKK